MKAVLIIALLSLFPMIGLCQGLAELLDAQLNITGRDIKQRQGENNKTALHIAAEKDLLEAAKWLINEGADLEANDGDGDTPLHEAAWYDSVDVARLLISRGAKVDAKNVAGQTPLHWAADQDSVDVARLLISRGAKVDAKGWNGLTPLYVAARLNSLKVAQLLIDNGADKNIKDNDGEKPIDWARRYGYSKMIALLGGQDGSACMTTNPKACVFPFKYKGVEYNSCTTEGNWDTLWCATSVTADGTYNGWRDCDTTKCQTE